jgi:hypothetical protein
VRSLPSSTTSILLLRSKYIATQQVDAAKAADTAGNCSGEWVPRFRGWRRGSLYRGDGEEFLVHEEKRGRG